MRINSHIYNTIRKSYGMYYGGLSRLDPEQITHDVLDWRKPKEQIELLDRFLKKQDNLRGKKLLEIGSGFGIFNVIARKEYGIDAWGIEPSSDDFDDAFIISQKILRDNDLTINTIVNAHGENLPFPDNSFDIVYSTNVLEHTKDPEKVIREAIRVCKRGGIIQIVAPNYGSFFDGHYACFYIPYQPKWFWKLWIKYILKRDPTFADTIRTEINYFSINNWLKKNIKNKNIEILSYGEEIFKERMMTGIFSDWAGLGKVRRWVSVVRKIKLTLPLVYLLLRLKAYSPIILTIRKN